MHLPNHVNRFCKLAVVLPATLAMTGPAQVSAITVQFDYRYDSAGFFDDPTRRDALEYAALTFERLIDELTAIQPQGTNRWDARFSHPETGDLTEIRNLVIPQSTIVVFAGSRDFGGSSTLGLGGPGGYWVSGSQSFINTVATRGQTGANDDPKTDFGPWGGMVTFSSSRTWHFDASTPPPSGSFDFHSVAVHELGHVFGIGTAASWKALADTEIQRFYGEESMALFGGPVPTDATAAHWDSSVSSQVGAATQQASMTPSISSASRKRFTEIDYAGLIDLGWESAVRGDTDLDGSITLYDAYLLFQNYGAQSMAHWTIGDFNNDGKVDSLDLALIRDNLGMSASATTAPMSMIPEPASVLLFAGAIPLLFRRKSA